MRDEMIRIVTELVNHGYCLFSETIEQYVDRMISYGFDATTQQEFCDNFMRTRA